MQLREIDLPGICVGLCETETAQEVPNIYVYFQQPLNSVILSVGQPQSMPCTIEIQSDDPRIHSDNRKL